MHHQKCPVGEGEAPASLTFKQLPLHLAMERTVDAVLYDFDEYHTEFGYLRSDIQDHYHATGMYASFPERADMLVERRLRGAGLVVMKTLIDEELMRRTLPHLDDTRSLLPSYRVHGNLYAEGAGQYQKGSYHDFMQAASALHLGAASAFFHRQAAGGPYENLWDIVSKQEQAYGEKWRAYRDAAHERGVRQLMPPFEPAGDTGEIIVAGVGNNTLSIQSVLLEHQRYLDKRVAALSGEERAAYLRQTALARAAFLLLPAGTNRSVFGQLLPDPKADEIEDGSLVCEDPRRLADAPRAIVRNAAGEERWNHASLKNSQPWRVPGSCAGIVPHDSTPEGRQVTDDFFAKASTYAGGHEIGRDENGKISSALVAHAIGSLVAEYTLYQD